MCEYVFLCYVFRFKFGGDGIEHKKIELHGTMESICRNRRISFFFWSTKRNYTFTVMYFFSLLYFGHKQIFDTAEKFWYNEEMNQQKKQQCHWQIWRNETISSECSREKQREKCQSQKKLNPFFNIHVCIAHISFLKYV